jgi:hypothetical protein
MRQRFVRIASTHHARAPFWKVRATPRHLCADFGKGIGDHKRRSGVLDPRALKKIFLAREAEGFDRRQQSTA